MAVTGRASKSCPRHRAEKPAKAPRQPEERPHEVRRRTGVAVLATATAAAGLGGGLLVAAGAPAQAADAAISATDGAWTVQGHGYGHGHGMSQWGAQSRARAGETASQILDFYYPGTGTATMTGRTLRVGLTSWSSGTVRVRSAGTEALTISTSSQTLAAGQTLSLTRAGSAVVGTAFGADGTTLWSETWTSAPTISGSNRFAIVDGTGAGTVYEGQLRIPVATGNVVPVDLIDLEAYLRGVVPAEAVPSWLPAALQAQAVAARSYALSTLAPSSAAYDICNTTACQVYHGYGSITAAGATTSTQPASTNAAVAATAGQYRTYGGTAAFTQFSADNGGWTSAVAGKPYLTAAADPYSTSTGSASGDAAGTWSAKLSVATVSASCPAHGTATALQPLVRDGNGDWGGRITSLRVICTTGSATVGTGTAYFNLKSNWWNIVPTLSGGAVTAAWQADGGATGALGAPTGEETATPNGRGSYEQFTGGSIYWTPSTGARVVSGVVRDKWSSLGWEDSALGFPSSDAGSTPDGVGTYQHFQGGSIYSTATTGTHALTTTIRNAWAALGWEGSALGYPTTDTTTTPDGRGTYAHFQNGSIYATPATGAHAISGAIRSEWASLGWERSALGYPVCDQGTTPDGKATYQQFQHGMIYTTASGTYALTGSVMDAWAALGYERSALGYPTSSSAATPAKSGAYAHFQNGSLYWSPTTGAHAVSGAVRTKWASLGWENSSLGFPTSDASTTPDGVGTYQHFQGGSVYSTASTGTHAIGATARDAWGAQGWERSWLGYPCSDTVTTVRAGVTTTVTGFQHGTMTTTTAAGRTTVTTARS